MKRKLESRLNDWKSKSKRLPLLILGARQVGKTYLVERFAKEQFADYLILNFQTDLERLSRVFEVNLDSKRIVRELGLLYGKNITLENTLLVFDEIQLCQPAITSLKYFAERQPGMPIIATGSLFGIALHRDQRYSFPVGKVEIAHLHPLDFEEYLWAKDRALWANGIRECFAANEPFLAHREASALYREYLMIGGLPAVVADFVATDSFDSARELQRSLSTLYTADMSIYLSDIDASRTRAIWNSIPRQLAREQNNKFKLADVKSGARQKEFEAPFSWLESAGLVFRHWQTIGGMTPFEPRLDGTFYKAYLLDVGLLSSQMGVRPDVFLDHDGYRQISPAFRGALAENYIKQTLEANEVESFYWTSGNRAEIDFIIQDSRMRPVPLDIKSADNVQSKSLKVYQDKYSPELSVRISLAEFGHHKGLKSVPLYAAFCIDPSF
jgi:predicted AAA+ superfamily ATPase